MRYEITTTEVSPQLIAAARARVARGTIGQVFGQSLDKVWEFLRRHPGLRNGGHNLFLYDHAGSDSEFLLVDFGVPPSRGACSPPRVVPAEPSPNRPLQLGNLRRLDRRPR